MVGSLLPGHAHFPVTSQWTLILDPSKPHVCSPRGLIKHHLSLLCTFKKLEWVNSSVLKWSLGQLTVSVQIFANALPITQIPTQLKSVRADKASDQTHPPVTQCRGLRVRGFWAWTHSARSVTFVKEQIIRDMVKIRLNLWVAIKIKAQNGMNEGEEKWIN